MPKLSIRDLDLEGKRVFVRVDFNVPLSATGEITEDTRIRQTLPTLEYALGRGARLVLASHLGRPKGKPNSKMSLAPVAIHLENLLNRPVAPTTYWYFSIIETGPKIGSTARRYNPLAARNWIRSRTRQEYPHSLSYQEITLTQLPATTRVSGPSTIEERSSPLKSAETSSSSV